MIRAHDCLDWLVCQLGRTLFQCHQVCYVSGKKIVLPSTFTLNGNTISVMKWKNRYRHLGVLLGVNLEAHLELKTSRWTSRASFSLLWRNWMKLEAFKEFVMPKLNYVFRTTLDHKKWTKLLDYHIRSSIKHSFGLPENVWCILLYVHEFRWIWTALHWRFGFLYHDARSQDANLYRSVDKRDGTAHLKFVNSVAMWGCGRSGRRNYLVSSLSL